MAGKKSEATRLADVAEQFLKHLERQGKTRGTVFSYEVDLGAAREYFGDERDVRSIVVGEVAEFNASKRVMRKSNGKAKAEPTIAKTRRVFRMMMQFAAEKGLIEKAPIAEAGKKKEKQKSESNGAQKPEKAAGSEKPGKRAGSPPPSGKSHENGKPRRPRPYQGGPIAVLRVDGPPAEPGEDELDLPNRG